MTNLTIFIEELIDNRIQFINTIREELMDQERKVILSIKSGQPQWDLFPLSHIKELPAVQWKLNNILKMNPKRHPHLAAPA